MFETMLKSAFDGGSELLVYMNGFNAPLKGRVQDLNGEFFTFLQSGKSGTVLWAFRLSDVISCGLLMGLPESATAAPVESSSLASLGEVDY